jgi:elongation factor G
MAKYETKDIRNVAFVGHSDSGKTTLADTILFKTKAVTRLGTIEDGTSVFDFEPDEKDRRNSVDLAVASCSVKGREINLFDAPGYADFAGEAVCALNAVETAVVCVNAAAGVKVNTRKMWDRARQAGVARAVAINKLDQENVDFAKVLKEIQETFGRECVPVFFPAGGAVVNIVEKFDATPAEFKELAKASIETLLECDDALMEEYLNTEKFSAAALQKALPKAIAAGKIVPVLCTSAKKETGVAEFIDFVANYFPSPADAAPKKAVDPEKKTEIVLAANAAGPLCGQVFKSVADPFVQKLSFIRVYSGTLSNDQQVFNQRNGKSARAGAFYKPFGKDQRACPSAVAGDIVCVTKVDDLNAGDTVCAPNTPIHVKPFALPSPMVSLAAEPKAKQDLARMSESIQKMAASDPTFKYTRDAATGELVMSGLSQLHLDVIMQRMKRKFGVELVTKQPKVPLKEAIVGAAEGHYKHKKQSGGRGQYGEVYLRVKPTARGEGFKFVDGIKGGSIPAQFLPPIEKGIQETLEKGVIAGYPVVDVEVEVYYGSYHEVDSGPESFKLAGSKAFKEAFKAAKPVLLEPIVNIEITVPAAHMGTITGDLNSRRGRIQGMDSQGSLQVIKAEIPLKEIITYSTDLHSATGGEGSYTFEFARYDPMPPNLAQRVIEAAKVHEEEE